MWVLLRQICPLSSRLWVPKMQQGQGQPRRIAIAKIHAVSSSTASVSPAVSTAKIAIAMDAATTLKMSQSERRPLLRSWRGTQTPSVPRSQRAPHHLLPLLSSGRAQWAWETP
jgi:hypothetical protein